MNAYLPYLNHFTTFSLTYYSENSGTSLNIDWNGYTVFTPLGWLATFVTLTSTFAVVHLVVKRMNINAMDSLSFALASFALRELDQNFVTSSRNLSMRIVCFTVMMSGFLLYSTYAATMTSFLSVSLEGASITDYEEVLKSGKRLV